MEKMIWVMKMVGAAAATMTSEKQIHDTLFFFFQFSLTTALQRSDSCPFGISLVYIQRHSELFGLFSADNSTITRAISRQTKHFA